MKKIYIITGLIFLLASCKKDMTSLNVDPKNPTVVPSSTLFSNAEKNLARNVASSNVNLNIWRLIMQQWQECTYVDESQYDLATRSIPQNWWHDLYRDVLKNAEECRSLIPNDVTDPDVVKNENAIIDILQVYTYYYLVTAYGDIPYSEALDFNIVQPKFDDAQTVFNSLATKLDAAISALNSSAEGFGSADLLYGGDIDAWRKFGNSLKMKMGITIADSDPAKAKTMVEEGAAGAFTSNDDNAMFQFLNAPPNTNPIWEDLVQSGRKDFVACKTLVNAMKGLSDPRVDLYFTQDASNDYSGGGPGESSNYSTFSKPSSTVTEPDFPGDLLDYSEIEFIKAEAVERGYNISGTAAEHYNNAVVASVEFWGGTYENAVTYLARPAVNYTTATGTYKQKIGTQKWIAMYNRGFDAWTEWRRLDYPQLPLPDGALTATPLRFTYPVSEQNVNGANYASAAAAIGGDEVTTKLWFDKN